jgi:crotonobetainyl-CoA:carnitine CoA-transferase CaiB-like acyl-CoA transferase
MGRWAWAPATLRQTLGELDRLGLVEQPHAAAGRVPLVANPIRLSGSPIEYRRAPPLLGEHTSEVLAQWLDLSTAAIEELHKREII